MKISSFALDSSKELKQIVFRPIGEFLFWHVHQFGTEVVGRNLQKCASLLPGKVPNVRVDVRARSRVGASRPLKTRGNNDLNQIVR
jgi:hypothetical protein